MTIESIIIKFKYKITLHSLRENILYQSNINSKSYLCVNF